jgi:hypothetical protein
MAAARINAIRRISIIHLELLAGFEEVDTSQRKEVSGSRAHDATRIKSSIVEVKLQHAEMLSHITAKR